MLGMSDAFGASRQSVRVEGAISVCMESTTSLLGTMAVGVRAPSRPCRRSFRNCTSADTPS